jgi:hypothetical protein
MLLILCASIAFAASFASSDDQLLIVMIRSEGTQALYKEANFADARMAAGLFFDPIIIRSGWMRFSMAVPSARNSGLERISYRRPLVSLLTMSSRSLLAVPQGT